MPGNANIEVWFDGGCELCQGSKEWCLKHDRAGRLRFIDFRTVDRADLPVSFEQLDAAMWIRDPASLPVGGFAAWVRILRVLPGWRWIGFLVGLPPFRWFGPPGYRLIARHRLRLTRIGRLETWIRR